MINAFSQLGNVAGSYVWDLKENGYRKSYGIVLSMFGITIVGCFAFRVILVRLNRELEQQEAAWDQQDDVAKKTAETAHVDTAEHLRMPRGFRYLV